MFAQKLQHIKDVLEDLPRTNHITHKRRESSIYILILRYCIVSKRHFQHSMLIPINKFVDSRFFLHETHIFLESCIGISMENLLKFMFSGATYLGRSPNTSMWPIHDKAVTGLAMETDQWWSIVRGLALTQLSSWVRTLINFCILPFTTTSLRVGAEIQAFVRSKKRFEKTFWFPHVSSF